MKKFLSLTFAFSLFAHAEDRWVMKMNRNNVTTGYGERTEECEIFASRVVITRSYGGGLEPWFTVETRPLSLIGDFGRLVRFSVGDPIQSKPNEVCGGDTTEIFADNGAGQMTNLLYKTGGCGFPRQTRSGNGSQMLLDMIKAYCPTVY